jgi:hypothetical protein
MGDIGPREERAGNKARATQRQSARSAQLKHANSN